MGTPSELWGWLFDSEVFILVILDSVLCMEKKKKKEWTQEHKKVKQERITQVGIIDGLKRR